MKAKYATINYQLPCVRKFHNNTPSQRNVLLKITPADFKIRVNNKSIDNSNTPKQEG